MDWQNPTEDQRVVLGVMKRPAKTKDNPMPPLFINPGVSLFFPNFGCNCR